MRFEFSAEIWVFAAEKASWRFVTVPKDISAGIRRLVPRQGPGFGTVRVTALIGETAWKTSLFPDSKRGAFVLPIKAEVRRKQKLQDGAETHVALELDF